MYVSPHRLAQAAIARQIERDLADHRDEARAVGRHDEADVAERARQKTAILAAALECAGQA